MKKKRQDFVTFSIVFRSSSLSRNKKSQVTIFAIIGIVLILLAGFFFYLNTFSKKKITTDESTEAEKAVFSTQPIQAYVKQCLEKTTKDGLMLLGRQGGVIFKSQKGKINDINDDYIGTFFIKYLGNKVPYAILPLSFDSLPNRAKAPEYPWITFPYIDAAKTDSTYIGVFGRSALPPLNSSFGSNSIKTQLETYIKENIGECLDWSIFSEQYSITPGKIKIEVMLNRENTVSTLDYPLEIESLIGEGKAELKYFSVNLGLRIQKIYSFTKKLVEKEITDVGYNPEEETFEDGMSVEIIRDVFGKDDIIIIRDQKSLIDNNPFEFIISRKNRLPALEYITPLKNKVAPEQDNPSKMFVSDSDIVPGGIENAVAKDPDEDELQFTIVPPANTAYYLPQVEFEVRTTDGELEDYQTITIIRGEST